MVNKSSRYARLLCVLALFVMSLGTGCTSLFIENYSFEFDLRKDGQSAYVLEYRYFAGKDIIQKTTPEYVEKGTHFTWDNIYAPMPRGTSLYVKWVDEETGKEHEDTVDLRSRLPRQLEGKTVYLMIRGAQLYVYVISTDRRSPNKPPIGPKATAYLDTQQIYPDNLKN